MENDLTNAEYRQKQFFLTLIIIVLCIAKMTNENSLKTNQWKKKEKKLNYIRETTKVLVIKQWQEETWKESFKQGTLEERIEDGRERR